MTYFRNKSRPSCIDAAETMDDSTSMLVSQIRLADRKFRRACSQVILLNNKIQMLKVRYDRAKADGRRSFRYGWRLQLATYEGVRNMFYEYAAQRCDEMERLQEQLRAQTGMEYEDFSDSEDETAANNSEDEQSEGSVESEDPAEGGLAGDTTAGCH